MDFVSIKNDNEHFFENMVIKVPQTTKPLNVKTWSYDARLRERIIIQPGDTLNICGGCTFERMCFHDITINTNDPKTFCSEDIVKIFVALNVPETHVPQHFKDGYNWVCQKKKPQYKKI